MPTATRNQPARLADPDDATVLHGAGDPSSFPSEVIGDGLLALPGLTGTERAELAASRAFMGYFRAWCVDSSHYSRMMAAFADYQNVIRLNEQGAEHG